MMKISKILWQTALLTTCSLGSVAVADRFSILGSYKGDGHTLDLDPGGDYHSCDPQNRCVTINRGQSSQQGNTRIWQNGGYSYLVTPIGQILKQGHHTRISLKIVNPQQQVILERIFRSQ
jgi:hypothetical protein